MSERDPLIILNEMLDSIEQIATHIQGMTKEEFSTSSVTQDAVVFRLAVLGEAAAQMSQVVKAEFPGIQWRLIVATRNHLIHGYFNINIETVWQTVQEDLPTLKRELQIAIQQMTTESQDTTPQTDMPEQPSEPEQP